MRRGVLLSATLLALVCVVAACNALLGLDELVVRARDASAGSDAGAESDGCVDEAGFGGRGCWRCEPKTSEEILTACTSSKFEVFDNETRITGFDPQKPLPPLPPPEDAGVDAGSDGGDAAPPADAGGDPECLSLGKPNPVLLVGATGFPLEVMSQAVGTEATIFFKETGSCLGMDAVFTGTTKMSGTAVYYDDGVAKTCVFSTPRPADLGPSALFPETCALPGLPADVGDYLGPITPVMFAAPAISRERAISAEAAYRVYGLGASSGVAPWTDERFIFRRNPASANQNAVALTLGLDVQRFRGVDSGGSSRMRVVLQGSTEPDKTIGISSSEIIDPNRATLRTLAYRHFGQRVAFYPDSDPATFDRRNVRDGHYYLWVSMHLYARLRSGEVVGGNPDLESGATPARSIDTVKNLVLYMTTRKAYPKRGVDVFGAQKAFGLVPQCAMRVTRTREGAALSRFSPPQPCHCAFEVAPPGTSLAECKSCSTDSECSAARPRCSFGYCE